MQSIRAFLSSAHLKLLGEMSIIFVLAPLLLVWVMVPWGLILWLACAGAWLWLHKREKFCLRDFWYGPDAHTEQRIIGQIIKRFCLNGLILFIGVWIFIPHQLIQLPREHTILWLTIIGMYPLLSVYPQELLFRAYFLRRYRAFGVHPRWLQAINAILFGLAHLLFGNWLAVVLSGIGGWFFADTYTRSRSLRLVWLEHSLYGLLIFTIGLGPFFISGRLI